MNLCIIQARMGSTRLPGKVLTSIHGKTMLQHVIDRLRPAASIQQLVVATTTQPEDDAIEAACATLGVACYRGSDWDVLDRFYQAATHLPNRYENIIRICCDNPTHHYAVVDYVMAEYKKYGTDYFSNGNEGPDFYEDGFTAEIFRFTALERAWQEAKLMSEREHVTPYIKRSGLFSCGWRKSSERYIYKLSVDTAEDLAFNERIFEALGNMFDMNALIDYLQSNEELSKALSNVTFNAGYLKSLKEDKEVK